MWIMNLVLFLVVTLCNMTEAALTTTVSFTTGRTISRLPTLATTTGRTISRLPTRATTTFRTTTVFTSASSNIFVDSPGVLRTTSGQTLSFRWNLSSPFDTSVGGARVIIYKHVYDPNQLNYIVRYRGAIGCDKTDDRISCITEGHRVGFKIENIVDSDADDYMCELRFSVGGTYQRNRNATLYMYTQPGPPTISPSSPSVDEGSELILQCNSESRSEPAAYRPGSLTNSRWYRDGTDITDVPPGRHSISGLKLTIRNVQRADAAFWYRCRAAEGGLVSTKSGAVSVNVRYPPDKVTVGVLQSYYIQGEDALRLTCFYPTDRGNPPAERLVWEKVGSSGAPTETTDGVVQIPAADVTVTEHDGQWRCWAQTATGQNPGQKAAVAVVVYARPHITHFTASRKNLTEGESFSLTCGVTSSPQSEISFIHMREGQTEIITPTRQDNNSAVYTKLSAGCRDAGTYRCQADNKVNEPTQSEDTHPLVVKCAPTAEYVWPPTQNLHIVRGESATFVVSLLAFPLVEKHITWRLSGSSILPPGTNILLHRSTTSLSIVNVTSSHYGNYTLTVDNEIGRSLTLWFSLSQMTTTPEKSGLSAGIVSGFAILVVLVLALIIALVAVIIRCRNMRDKNKGHQTVTESVTYMNVGVETSTKQSDSKIGDSSRVELQHPVDITTGTYDELGETIQYQGPYEELHVK